MEWWKYSLGALLVTLSQLCLLLATSPPMRVLRVPSTAKPGHVISMLPNQIHNGVYRMRMGNSNNNNLVTDPSEDLSKYFSVMDQGHLITTQNVSHLDGQHVPLNVEHIHPKDPSQSWSQNIFVLVTSDALPGPQFTDQPYRGSLLENMPSGSSVTQLDDLSKALSQFASFANLTLVSGDTDLFSLQMPEFPSPGDVPSLVAMDTFDREARPDYSVTIEADDGSGLLTHAIIQIDIEDSNEHAPKFDLPYYLSELPTEIKSFKDGANKLLSVFASDGDKDDVEYSLEDTMGDLFKIDPFKGDIGFDMDSMFSEMTKSLDEFKSFVLDKSYELMVHADDGKGRKDSTLVQLMSPVTDEPRVGGLLSRRKRQTSSSPLIYVVNRQTPSNTRLFTVEQNTDERFGFHASTGMEYQNIMFLDAEEGYVSLRQQAQWNASWTEVPLVVNVTSSTNQAFQETRYITIKFVDRDAYDPIFSNEPYPLRALVPMWIRPYTTVMAMKSIDAELGAQVTYQIESGANGRFTVDPVTGELRTHGRAPYTCTQDEPFKVAISVHQMGAPPQLPPPSVHTPAQVVEIYCDEINPQFYQDPYVVDMREDTTTSQVVVEIKAKSFYRLDVAYTIASEFEEEPVIFRIDSRNGNVYPLKELNYLTDKRRYSMIVTATERNTNKQTQTKLIVMLTDVNNHAPVFPLEMYVAQDVREDLPLNENILTVSVIDKDFGINSEVTFESSDPRFTVESDRNNQKIGYIHATELGLYVEMEKGLDYDFIQGRKYEFIVTATDKGEPAQSGTASVRIWMKNVNDRPPQFDPPEQRWWVKERAPRGTVVGVVQAHDLDGDGLTYRFIGGDTEFSWGPFQLDPSTGYVTLSETLRGGLSVYNLEVEARDDGSCCPDAPGVPHTARGKIIVDFIGVNRPPQFGNCRDYQPTLRENQGDGATVIQIQATDPDSGSNGELTYSYVVKGNEDQLFDVRATDNGAEVFALFDFDRENPELGFRRAGSRIVFPVTVKVEDNGRPKLSATCFFLVEIEDVNDQSPTFDSGPYYGFILRGLNRGARVTRVHAVDRDYGQNAEVRYSITEESQCPSCFNIDPNTGMITMGSSSIPDNLKDITIEVEARDQGSPAKFRTVNVVIEVVERREDLPPEWQSMGSTPLDDLVIQVSESEPVKYRLPQLFTAQPMRQSNVLFFAVPGRTPQQNNDKNFVAVEDDDNENSMKLEINEALDYEETPEYTILLRASYPTSEKDNLRSDARIQINLIDVNDERPEFIGFDENGKYPAAVSEEANPALEPVVGHLFAIDGDGTFPNNNVEYFFDENCEECSIFRIDRTTGEIKLIGALADDKDTYTLLVNARDGDGTMPADQRNEAPSPVYVTVQVTRASQNPPEFEKEMYTLTVNEGLMYNTTIGTIIADDPNPDMNRPQYAIMTGNTGHVFAVDSLTGRIYAVGELVFREQSTYQLQYRVFDGLESNFATVEVTLRAQNLFPPKFQPLVYNAGTVPEVIENGKLPYRLTTVSATGSDPNAPISYSLGGYLVKNEGSGFSVNDNGEVFVTQPSLDRDPHEGYPTWQLNVIASVPGSSQKGYGILNISPTDVNDNGPVFDMCCVVGSIPENNNANDVVFTVKATDADASPNGDVYFTTLDGPSFPGTENRLFGISEVTGEVRALIGQSLDRERQDSYVITVTARDNAQSDPSGQYDRRYATQKMIIQVSDVNDNAPVFPAPKQYSFTIPEELPIGAVVGYVSASDDDIGVNAERTYSIDGGGFDSQFFYMDSIFSAGTGVIKIKQNIDYESALLVDRILEFRVKVEDPNPLHQDFATVIINITDANDNPPEILPQRMTVNISEDVKSGTPVYQSFLATDKDLNDNSQFQFAIDYANSDPFMNFRVEPEGGGVFVKNPLDRERVAVHRVLVLAIDEGEPQMTGTATLTVNVMDINDHGPEFADYDDIWLPKTTRVGAVITRLKIIDQDSPMNGPPFEIADDVCRNKNNPICRDFNFEIRGTMRDEIVILAKRSDYTRDSTQLEEYSIDITMSDNGAPKQQNTERLVLHLQSNNDNPHSAGTKNIQVYNYKGLFGDVMIGSVYVEDPDFEDEAEKSFKFIGDHDGFEVNDMGEITMKHGVNPAVHNLKVEVRDSRATAISTVIVNVVSIDDDAVMSSGSLTIPGTTAEKFIRPGPDGQSNKDKFQGKMAELLETEVKNVDVFTVRDIPVEELDGAVEEGIDVRFSAHGSPYYRSARLDGLVWTNKDQFKDIIGGEILTAPVDRCAKKMCFESGCSNDLIVTEQPLVINSPQASLVGVSAYTEANCVCRARDPIVPENTNTCNPAYCLNGGTCHETWADTYCECPRGFDGARCQQLVHSFSGNGWAWYNPLAGCEDDTISVEFATKQLNGLILFNGPLYDTDLDNQDFISLELVEGYPRLRLNLGDGETTVEVTGNNAQGEQRIGPMNDGRWHTIEVVKNKFNVRLIVDHCEDSQIIEDINNSVEDRSACEVTKVIPGERFILNVFTPLQLGGRAKQVNYPADFSGSGFNGCIRNLRHNGEIYDLHIGEVGEQSGSEDGCPRTEDACSACPVNSTCDGNLDGQAKCRCLPGLRGEKCDIGRPIKPMGDLAAQEDERRKKRATDETSSKDLQTGAPYVQWQLEVEFNRTLDKRNTDMQIMFRTRQPNGIIFMTSSFSTLERIILEVVDSHLQMRIDFGSDDRILSLPHVNVSDGLWHTAHLKRWGNQAVLQLDGGDGRYYTEADPEDGHRLISLSADQVFAGSEVAFPAYWNEPEVLNSLENSCLNDLRYNNEWFPMTKDENDDSSAADLLNEQDVGDGCADPALCGTAAGPACLDPLVCRDIWRLAICECKPRYMPVDSGEVCIPIMDCSIEQCSGHGTCSMYNGRFRCDCDDGWTGERCDIRAEAVVGGAALTTGAIIAIVVCLLVLLLLILLFLLISRRRNDKMLLEVDAADDIRENVVFYDEEGAGEEDMQGYDISRLQIPMGDTDSMTKVLPPEEPIMHRRDMMPNLGNSPGLEPMPDRKYPSFGPDGKYPHVGDFIDDRMGDADDDPNAPPFDSVREYQYEGSGSLAGSLSSLQSSSSGGDQDYEYLDNWGPRFQKLADLYGGGHDDEDDEDASSV